MPWDDLSGTSGFTSDSEGVEANLDINVSEESARNLWDVQAAVQQIASDFQTAVRAASDFQSYLISIRETSQTVKMPSGLGMEGGEGGNMSYAGGRVDSGSVPMAQGEAGMASRISEMEENASGAGGGAMASASRSAGHPVDVSSIVAQATNTAWLLSQTGHQGGGGGQGGGGNLRLPVVGGMGGGGFTAAAEQIAQATNRGTSAAQQFLRGGGLGGAAGLLGRLGTYGAMAYAGYQLVDAGLETYAQSRSMGIAANNQEGGTGWGFGRRVGQASMAMSPFVSQEEAAQIYSSAIDQGWASRRGGFEQGDFSSAVNFMYGAAKDYNIDPATSAKMLQNNVLGAGQSIQALSQQLFTLKEALDGTGVSMGTATNTFSSFSSFLIGAGATPGDAARIAGGTIRSFAGNTYLGPNASGAATVQAALQNPQIQAVLGGLTGNLPGAALAGANANRSVKELETLVHSLATQYANSTNITEENRVALFQVAYNQLTGQNIDFKMAQQLMMEAVADPNFMTKGQNEFDKASQMTLQHQNSLQSWWQGLDDPKGWSRSQSGAGMSLQETEENASQINSYNYYSPEVNTLLQNAGDDLRNVVLYGPDGNPVMMDGNRVAGANIAKWFNDQNNYNMFNKASNGYYIQDKSGNKYNAANIGTGGSGAGTTTAGGDATNTVYITLSPEAKKYFSTNTDKLNLSDGKNP